MLKGKKSAGLLLSWLLTFTVAFAIAFGKSGILNANSAGSSPNFQITVDAINGYSQPFPPVVNPVHLEGSVSAFNFVGNLEQYQVQVDWGDGTVDADSICNFALTDLDGDGRNDDFYGTWSSSPDHNYVGYGDWVVTVKLYHQMPPGAESADAEVILTITVMARITLLTDPEGLNVTVDGEEYTTPMGFDWYAGETHSIGVATTQYGSSGVRYVWLSWSDGGEATHDIIVSPTPATYIANFKTQYYLTVNSPYGAPGGEGWYDCGSTAYACLDIGVLDHGNGTRRVFTGWDGDASGTDYAKSSPITMDSPKTAVANWKTQYYLEVSSLHDDPSPDTGWYDAGTSFTASVSSPVPGAEDTRYVCIGWTGTGSVPPCGSGATFTFTLTQPSSITWNWKTQHLLTVETNPSGLTPQPTITPYGEEGSAYSWWYDASTIVTLTAQTVADYTFNYWSVDGVPQGSEVNPIFLVMDAPHTATAHYTGIVTTAQVTFNVEGVSSDFTGTVLTVDDTEYTLESLPLTFTWEIGSTHTFAYSSPMVVSIDAKQYVWTSTSGLSTAQIGTVGVTGEGGTVTAYYKTQYYLKVQSAYGTATGEGWYDEDATAYAGLNTGLIESDGTRHLFVEWTGDAAGTNHAQSSPIIMNAPKTALAAWKTQYYLDVVSPYGDPEGMGWYDEGAIAYAILDRGLEEVPYKVRAVFKGWGGDASGEALVSNPITMDAPKTAVADWNTQFYLVLKSNPEGVAVPSGGGWYDAGTYAYISTVQYVEVAAGSTRYLFESWTAEDTDGILNPNASSTSVLMDKAKTLTANYAKQHYLAIAVEPAEAATIPGEGWYKEGSTVRLTAPKYSHVTDEQRFHFAYWVVDGTASFESTLDVHMDKPHLATAHYKMQYRLTFSQTGLDIFAYGKALTVNGSTINVSGLPFTIWVDNLAAVNYSFENVVSSSLNGERYKLESVTGPGSPITVTGAAVVTGNYVAQCQIIFSQSGVGLDFSGVVVNVDGTGLGVNDLPKVFWWDRGSVHSYEYYSPLGAGVGKRYVWASITGFSALQSGEIAIYGSGMLTGNYEAMYYLNVVSEYGYTYGSGWYQHGATVVFGVTTPIDHGNGTMRVFLKWYGDASVFEPEGTITMTKPSTVTASWETRYLVTFNTALPNKVVLNIPNVPKTLPPGMGVFGTYYSAGELVVVGPAPTTVMGSEDTRYVFKGWTLDNELYTGEPNLSFVVKKPSAVAVAYETEFLLVVNVLGVKEPFKAVVAIVTSPPAYRELSPANPVQEWIEQDARVTLTISTPNKIGHGEWAIFKEWTGHIVENDRTASFTMLGSTVVNAVFFKVNPVAQSLPYSILAGLLMMLLCAFMANRRKSEGRRKLRSAVSGVTVAAAAIIVAAIISSAIALGYGINPMELPDLTNWAVVFLAIEATLFLVVSAIVVGKVQRKEKTEENKG